MLKKVIDREVHQAEGQTSSVCRLSVQSAVNYLRRRLVRIVFSVNVHIELQSVISDQMIPSGDRREIIITFFDVASS